MSSKEASFFQMSLQRRIIKHILGSMAKSNVSSDELGVLLRQSSPVNDVVDIYAESPDRAYIVIALDPSSPLIRVVPRAFLNSFPTLASAKKEARSIIQRAIADAEQSLVDLRQVGIEKINYLTNLAEFSIHSGKFGWRWRWRWIASSP